MKRLKILLRGSAFGLMPITLDEVGLHHHHLAGLLCRHLKTQIDVRASCCFFFELLFSKEESTPLPTTIMATTSTEKQVKTSEQLTSPLVGEGVHLQIIRKLPKNKRAGHPRSISDSLPQFFVVSSGPLFLFFSRSPWPQR